jgi:hypothetical protein
MPNETAIREFTRRIPLPTLAVLRSKASRSALLGLLVLTVSGCGDDAPTPLAPTPPAATPPPGPSVTVRLEGRVLDEQNQPVAGATVRLLSPPVGPAPSTTADDAGGFSLTVDWLAHWRSITLRADRQGYEVANVHVQQSPEASREVLITMHRSLTISPGESIRITVSSRFFCGEWETEPCRRALVNAPSGESVDLEVVPADGPTEAGLLRAQFGLLRDLSSRLTVAGGDEVWIVVDKPGLVTLRAAGR